MYNIRQFPNVQGSFEIRWGVNLDTSGCFWVTQGELATQGRQLEDKAGRASFNFSASRSSSVFGTSTKVQPKATQLLMIIKN